jgi:hypothetical protein
MTQDPSDSEDKSLVVQETELNVEPVVDEHTGKTTYRIRGKLMRRPDGSLVPTTRFDMLGLENLDDYSDLEFTDKDLRRMHAHIMSMRMGTTASAPLQCSGPVKCIFRHRCPLIDRSLKLPGSSEINFAGQNAKKFPLLRPCIFEAEFLDAQRQGYIQEYNVNEDSPTEMMMVSKLAELDLYDYRATLVLSHGDKAGDGMDLLKEQVTGCTQEGTILKRLELHPAFEVKQRIQKLKSDILEAMVGTRREQYKQAAALRQENNTDPSSIVAELKKKILQIEQGDVDIIDTEFTEDTDPTE